MTQARALVVLTVIFGFQISTATAERTFLQRAIQDLKECRKIDAPVCRRLPGRLAEYGGKAVKAIRPVFWSLSPAAQVLALATIKQITHRSSTNMLIELAKKSPLMIRQVAISALSTRRGKAVDKTLRNTLRLKNPTFRALAAEALGRFKKNRNVKKACALLILAADESVSEVRIKALESLGMLECKNSLKVLTKALKRPTQREKSSALLSLRFLGDKRASGAIIALLLDKNDMVVRDAANALRRLTGVDYGTDYALWDAWWQAETSEE